MKHELSDVLKDVRKIGDFDTILAPHYLLGYLWASLTYEKRQQVSDEIAKKANKQEAK